MEPLPRRVRADGLQRPGSGTMLANTDSPAAGRQSHREYRIGSRYAHRGWYLHSRAPCWGLAVLSAGYGDGRGLSLYAAAPGRRAISAETSAVRRGSAPAGIRPWRGRFHCFGPR